MGLFENFPYTNFHRENLDWLLQEVKNLVASWAEMQTEFTTLEEAFTALKSYVENYFEDLDVQEEINQKIDEMAASGELTAILSSLIPSTVERTLYEGLTVSAQDGAIFDGKLFIIDSNDAGTLSVYDFANKTRLANVVLDGGYRPHGNAVTFGAKMNPADPYPLLYVTGYNGYDNNNARLDQGTCFVYRINEDYTNRLIQIIKIGFTADTLWTGSQTSSAAVSWGNFVADSANNLLYVYNLQRNNNILSTRLFKFRIPDTSESDVTLVTGDILGYYDLPYYPIVQGATCQDGKLYISFGNEADTPRSSALSVVDVNSMTQLGYVYLGDIMTEPESVVFYDGAVYVARNQFYKMGTIPVYTNIGDLANLKTLRNNTIVDAINSLLDVEDWSSRVLNNVSMQFGVFTRVGKIAFISYQGQSVPNPEDKVVLTIPEGYRPNTLVFFSAIAGGENYIMQIKDNGDLIIYTPGPSSASNKRLFFSIMYTIGE